MKVGLVRNLVQIFKKLKNNKNTLWAVQYDQFNWNFLIMMVDLVKNLVETFKKVK